MLTNTASKFIVAIIWSVYTKTNCLIYFIIIATITFYLVVEILINLDFNYLIVYVTTNLYYGGRTVNNNICNKLYLLIFVYCL